MSECSPPFRPWHSPSRAPSRRRAPSGWCARVGSEHWEQIGDHGFDVAIVGATGVVGQMLLCVMTGRRFPVRRFCLLASDRSRETTLGFRGRTLPVHPASDAAFEGAQLAFFAATNELSETLVPAAVARGAIAIAGNVIAQCGALAADTYSSEEHKLLEETRKILELPALSVAATAVRVPVEVGHSASVLLETESALDLASARAAYGDFPGVRYVATDAGPPPLDVIESDEVLVGRLRKDFATDRLWLWQVSNNLRKGAATNALQVAEALWARSLVKPRTGLA